MEEGHEQPESHQTSGSKESVCSGRQRPAQTTLCSLSGTMHPATGTHTRRDVCICRRDFPAPQVPAPVLDQPAAVSLPEFPY